MSDITQLLEETSIFAYKIDEYSKGDDVFRVSGLYQLGDVVNANRRMYRSSLWEKNLAEGAELARKLKNRQVLGELGHPQDGNTTLSKVSHLVTELKMDKGRSKSCQICEQGGNPHTHVWGKEEVLSTPEGKILRELYERNVTLGISSRGKGQVRQENDYSVVDENNYKPITWDHVLDPSTPGSYPRHVSEDLVSVIEGLVEPTSNSAELQGYRNVLSEVLAKNIPEELRDNVIGLVENIDSRLSSASVGRVLAAVPSGVTNIYLNSNDTNRRGSSGPSVTSEVPEMSGTTNLDSPEVKRLIREAFAEANAADNTLTSRYEAQLDELGRMITHLEGQLEEANKKLVNSEKLGNELLTQLRESKIRAEAYKNFAEGTDNGQGELEEAFETLSIRHEKAKELIEALFERAKKGRYFESRCVGTERLLSEMLTRINKDRVSSHVRTLTNSLPESVKPRISAILSESRSVSDVNKKFASLSQLMESTSEVPAKPVRTEGKLPSKTVVNTPLNESLLTKPDETRLNEKNENGTLKPVGLARALTRKMSGARA